MSRTALTAIAEQQPEVWHYVALGDSTVVLPGTGMMGNYKAMLESDLGVKIDLQNKAHLSGGAARLIQELNTPQLREALQSADVITLQIPIHNLEPSMRRYTDDPEECGGEDQQDCLREAFNQYKRDTEVIFTKLMEIVDPEVQLVRVQDMYLVNVTDIKERGTFDVYNDYWQDAQMHIHEVAEQYGIPVAAVYDDFMGTDGTDDPAEKGLMSDITHASIEGAKRMAQLIRALGYEYASAGE